MFFSLFSLKNKKFKKKMDQHTEHDLLIGEEEENWKIYETVTLKGCDWKSPLFTILAIVGGSLQGIVLPLWYQLPNGN